MKTRSVVTAFSFVFLLTLVFPSINIGLQEAVAQISPSSHFRGSSISWTPQGANTAEFDASWASRRSGCTSTNGGVFSGPGGLAGVGDICREFTGFTTLIFGDGTSSTDFAPIGDPVWIRVNFIDVANNYIVGDIVDPSTCAADVSPDGINSATCQNWTHVYPSAGPFTAEINSGARTGVEINNPNANYVISTQVDLNTPPQPNSSPVTSQSPIVQCPQNSVCQYQVPAIDANSDVLSYRLSLLGEWGADEQPGQAGSAGGCNNQLSISSSGLVTWDTQNCSLGLYSTSHRISETKVGAITPHGYVMVDYLIQIVPPSANNPPAFDVPPMSPDNTNFNLEVGDAFNAPVSCTDPDTGDAVTLGNLGLPPGASITPQVGSNPGTQTFSWTPAAPGVQIVTFTCQDTSGATAPAHDYTFQVTENIVGGQILPIDNTALLLAGIQSSPVWILSALVIVSSVAFGTLYLKVKRD